MDHLKNNDSENRMTKKCVFLFGGSIIGTLSLSMFCSKQLYVGFHS